MHKIEAIIRRLKLNDVRGALAKLGIDEGLVTEVRGCGQQKGCAATYRGVEYRIDLVAKLKLELLIADDELDDVIRCIELAAYTGRVGDGQINVVLLEEAFEIASASQPITGDRMLVAANARG